MTPGHVAEALARAVDDATPASGARVLEAGCGWLPPEVPWPAGTRVVGIDTSRAQLERNATVDEKLLGDICTYSFDGQFDVVSCWDVLEHLPSPEAALRNLAGATRPGGLLVVKVPNVLSLKGLVTKLTPHRVHVWAYRRLYGYESAGHDDRGPFRTFLRLSLSERGLRRFAARQGLAVELVARYESEHQVRLRRRLRLDGAPWRALCILVRVATAGRIALDATELVVLMRK